MCPSAKAKAEITKALKPVLDQYFQGPEQELPVAAIEAALRPVLGAVTVKPVSDEVDAAIRPVLEQSGEEHIVLAKEELSDEDMCRLLFDWILERNPEAITELVRHGESRGEPYVLVISEEGKDEEGDMDVSFEIRPLSGGEKHFNKPDAPAAIRGFWVEFRKEIEAHPDYIPLILRSATYERSQFRLYSRNH